MILNKVVVSNRNFTGESEETYGKPQSEIVRIATEVLKITLCNI
jgi:ribonucleotide monophosphatase NagD (HAD superfamily)